jgi:hypothetical protein
MKSVSDRDIVMLTYCLYDLIRKALKFITILYIVYGKMTTYPKPRDYMIVSGAKKISVICLRKET